MCMWHGSCAHLRTLPRVPHRWHSWSVWACSAPSSTGVGGGTGGVRLAVIMLVTAVVHFVRSAWRHCVVVHSLPWRAVCLGLVIAVRGRRFPSSQSSIVLPGILGVARRAACLALGLRGLRLLGCCAWGRSGGWVVVRGLGGEGAASVRVSVEVLLVQWSGAGGWSGWSDVVCAERGEDGAFRPRLYRTVVHAVSVRSSIIWGVGSSSWARGFPFVPGVGPLGRVRPMSVSASGAPKLSTLCLCRSSRQCVLSVAAGATL